MTNVNGTLIFTSNDQDTGRELWRSDGTYYGTFRFPEIVPGPYGTTFGNDFLNVGGVLYFSANDIATGVELWKLDPTPRVTALTGFGPGNHSVNLLTFSGTTLPWALTSIQATFSEPVTAATASLLLNGLNQPGAVVAGSGTSTVIWTFASPVEQMPGLLLRGTGSSAIIGSLGVGLDGNGDFAGGDDLVLNDARVLAGDYNGDSAVTAVDLSMVRALAMTGAFDTRADFDGDNDVDNVDVNYVRLRTGRMLPSAAPPFAPRGNPSPLPTVDHILSGTANGTYITGQTIDLTLIFSTPVVLTGGMLQLTLDTGAIVEVAPFSGLSVTVTWTVGADDASADLNVVAMSLAPTATLRNQFGQNALLSLPSTNLAMYQDFVVNPLSASSVVRVIAFDDANRHGQVTSLTIELAEPIDAAFLGLAGTITLTSDSGYILRSGTAFGGRIVVANDGDLITRIELTFVGDVAEGVENEHLRADHWRLNIPWLSLVIDLDDAMHVLINEPDPELFMNDYVAFDFMNNQMIDPTELHTYGTSLRRRL